MFTWKRLSVYVHRVDNGAANTHIDLLTDQWDTDKNSLFSGESSVWMRAAAHCQHQRWALAVKDQKSNHVILLLQWCPHSRLLGNMFISTARRAGTVWRVPLAWETAPCSPVRYTTLSTSHLLLDDVTFLSDHGPAITSPQVEIEVPHMCKFIMHTRGCVLREVSYTGPTGRRVYMSAPGSDAFQGAMEK